MWLLCISGGVRLTHCEQMLSYELEELISMSDITVFVPSASCSDISDHIVVRAVVTRCWDRWSFTCGIYASWKRSWRHDAMDLTFSLYEVHKTCPWWMLCQSVFGFNTEGFWWILMEFGIKICTKFCWCNVTLFVSAMCAVNLALFMPTSVFLIFPQNGSSYKNFRVM
jgi:hypothetical protein